MKYGENNIDLLEELPNRVNRAAYLTEKYGDMWNTNLEHREWNTASDRNPWKLADRLLQHYTGKKFDDFFADWSERCKHNDLLMQYKYNFKYKLTFEHDGCDLYWHYVKYYVDKNGIIRKKGRLTKKKRLKNKTPKVWYEQQASIRKAIRKTIEKEYKFKRDNEEQISKTTTIQADQNNLIYGISQLNMIIEN
jgi:hypothetical protein